MVWNREISPERWLEAAESISQMWAPLSVRGIEIGSSYLTLIPGTSVSDDHCHSCWLPTRARFSLSAGNCFSGGEVVGLLEGNGAFGVGLCAFILEL